MITEGCSSALKTYTVYALRKFIETVIKVRFDAPTHGEGWCVRKRLNLSFNSFEKNTDFLIASFLGTADSTLQSQYDFVSSSYSI